MAARPSWKGFLKVSLVSVPVRAFTASSSSGGGRGISLNMLHEPCKSRIRYQKVCPIHGEVTSDEIVSGYEYAKDQYVIVDADELDNLRTENDRSINVDSFVPLDSVDTLYLSGQAYYVVPDGAVGQKAFALLREALQTEQLQAIGHVVLSSRQRLVSVRPLGNLLMMHVLQHEAQVKKPDTFDQEVQSVAYSPQELKLTKSLLAAMTSDQIDLSQYKDDYVEKLTELIQAKAEGKQMVVAAEAPPPPVINLMDALKESVKRVKVPQSKPAAARARKAKIVPIESKPARKRRSG